MKRIACMALAGLLPWLTGCTFISKAGEYNGLPGQQGRPVAYYSATSVGVNLLFVIPLIGDTSTAATLRDLTKKIKEDGGSNVRVVQSSGTIFWYIFMPLTFIIHPAVGSVSADAEFAGPSGVEVKPPAAEPPAAEPPDKKTS